MRPSEIIMKHGVIKLAFLIALSMTISGFGLLITTTRFSELRSLLHDQTMYILGSRTPDEIKLAGSATDDLLVLRYNSLTSFGSESAISTCNKLFSDTGLVLIDRISTGVVTSYYAIYLKQESRSTKLIRYRVEGAASPIIDTIELQTKINIDSLFVSDDSLSYQDIARNNYTVLSSANKHSCKVKLRRNVQFNSWFSFE